MKRLIICILWLLPAVIGFSQTTPRQPYKFDPSKLEFGGNFGLAFGNRASSVIIAPQVGYAFDSHLSAGAGVNYSYYHYSDYYGSTSLNYMGLNVYARAKPIQPIVLQIQPEIYRMWGSAGSQIVPTLLVGGGVIIPMGGAGGMMLMLYYDVAQNSWSPYGNGIFYSVGYTVYF